MHKNKKSFPWINCKGSDCTLIMKFLPVATSGFLLECQDSEQRRVLTMILSMARLGVKFFDLMYQHGMWLDHKCGATLYEVGSSFTNGYGLLAAYAMENQQCLFSLKPKMHFYRHILIDLKEQLDKNCSAILSPVVFDCQQDEDLIGRLCKLSRQVDSRVLMRRTLEFYLVKASSLSRRHLKRCGWGPGCSHTSWFQRLVVLCCLVGDLADAVEWRYLCLKKIVKYEWMKHKSVGSGPKKVAERRNGDNEMKRPKSSQTMKKTSFSVESDVLVVPEVPSILSLLSFWSPWLTLKVLALTSLFTLFANSPFKRFYVRSSFPVLVAVVLTPSCCHLLTPFEPFLPGSRT